jgi:hypothetical protein
MHVVASCVLFALRRNMGPAVNRSTGGERVEIDECPANEWLFAGGQWPEATKRQDLL